VGLGRRKKEDTSKYYYVVYSWEIKGKGCGTGACTITVTAPGDFLISSVAKDISEKLSRGSVIILNWREITKKQSEEFVGAPEEVVTEETKVGGLSAEEVTSNTLIMSFISRALIKKFDGDLHKVAGWLSTLRPQWLMMDANELIRIGDASRVLEFLEKDV
jgi:hypothetical protein